MNLYQVALAQELKNAGHAVEAEYRFHPTRKFRFDLAIPEKRLAIEIEGAVYVRGGHSTGRGIEKDCEKGNLATLAGWRLLRFTTTQLRDKYGECLDQIREALCKN